jgi:murein DD-endopeptidase MepM/ murein hydrolase activator NlpD
MKVQHPPVLDYKHRKYPDGDVTQWFGVNRDLYFSAMGIEGHNGIDIVRPWFTPLYAVEDGIVADVKNSPDGFGKHLRIISERSGSEWTYGHNAENLVEIGQEVKAGDMIARMGNTGFVVSSQNAGGFWSHNPYAGTHLHLGRREVKIANRRVNGNYWRYNFNTPWIEVQNYDNGFKGAVNFADMLMREDVADQPVTFDGIIRLIIWLKKMGFIK